MDITQFFFQEQKKNATKTVRGLHISFTKKNDAN